MRATQDLDIAIAISNWREYKTVEKGILKIEGFTKDIKQAQPFNLKIRLINKFFSLF